MCCGFVGVSVVVVAVGGVATEVIAGGGGGGFFACPGGRLARAGGERSLLPCSTAAWPWLVAGGASVGTRGGGFVDGRVGGTPGTAGFLDAVEAPAGGGAGFLDTKDATDGGGGGGFLVAGGFLAVGGLFAGSVGLKTGFVSGTAGESSVVVGVGSGVGVGVGSCGRGFACSSTASSACSVVFRGGEAESCGGSRAGTPTGWGANAFAPGFSEGTSDLLVRLGFPVRTGGGLPVGTRGGCFAAPSAVGVVGSDWEDNPSCWQPWRSEGDVGSGRWAVAERPDGGQNKNRGHVVSIRHRHLSALLRFCSRTYMHTHTYMYARPTWHRRAGMRRAFQRFQTLAFSRERCADSKQKMQSRTHHRTYRRDRQKA